MATPPANVNVLSEITNTVLKTTDVLLGSNRTAGLEVKAEKINVFRWLVNRTQGSVTIWR